MRPKLGRSRPKAAAPAGAHGHRHGNRPLGVGRAPDTNGSPLPTAGKATTLAYDGLQRAESAEASLLGSSRTQATETRTYWDTNLDAAGTIQLPGVYSRKKQIVPLLGRIAEMARTRR